MAVACAVTSFLSTVLPTGCSLIHVHRGRLRGAAKINYRVGVSHFSGIHLITVAGTAHHMLYMC